MDIISVGLSLINSFKNLWPRKPKMVVHFRNGESLRQSASVCVFALTFVISNRGAKNCSLTRWEMVFNNTEYDPNSINIKSTSSPQIIDIAEGISRELNAIGTIGIQKDDIKDIKGHLSLEFNYGRKCTCEFCVQIKDVRNNIKKIFQGIHSHGFLEAIS